jgi:hypothetical protein
MSTDKVWREEESDCKRLIERLEKGGRERETGGECVGR